MYIIQYRDEHEQDWRERFRCDDYRVAETEFNDRWIELIKLGYQKVQLRIVRAGHSLDGHSIIVREVLRFEERH